MQWWDDFWKWANESQLGAAVVGGLLVAAVVGLIAAIPKWRKPAVAAIKRAWAFITDIRLTTQTRIDAQIQAAVTASQAEPKANPRYQLVPMDEFKKLTAPPPLPAPPPAREPVTWSARRRPGGMFVLTNLSKTDAALHVEVDSGGLYSDPWQEPAWARIGPGKTVTLGEGHDGGWAPVRNPQIHIIWEDEDGRAYQENVQVIGA